MKVLGKFEVTMGSMNANKEITKVIVDGQETKGSEIPEELRKWFKEQPRVSCRSNGSPKIKFDGQEVQLGYWACNQSELDMYKASRSGTSSGHSVKAQELSKFSKELLELHILDKVSPECKAFFESCILEDKAMTKARDALAGLTKEQMAALLASLKQDTAQVIQKLDQWERGKQFSPTSQAFNQGYLVMYQGYLVMYQGYLVMIQVSLIKGQAYSHMTKYNLTLRGYIMKKVIKFLCPLIMFTSEFILLFIKQDTPLFYTLLGLFSVTFCVSAYLWRKELF